MYALKYIIKYLPLHNILELNKLIFCIKESIVWDCKCLYDTKRCPVMTWADSKSHVAGKYPGIAREAVS